VSSDDPWFKPTSPENQAMIDESKRLAFESFKNAHLNSYGWGVVKPTQTTLIAERGMPLKASGTPAAVNQQAPKPLRWWERWERELYKILGVTDGPGKADRGSGGSVGAETHASEQDERDGR
jgi:hypothetical protein